MRLKFRQNSFLFRQSKFILFNIEYKMQFFYSKDHADRYTNIGWNENTLHRIKHVKREMPLPLYY